MGPRWMNAVKNSQTIESSRHDHYSLMPVLQVIYGPAGRAPSKSRRGITDPGCRQVGEQESDRGTSSLNYITKQAELRLET